MLKYVKIAILENRHFAFQKFRLRLFFNQ